MESESNRLTHFPMRDLYLYTFQNIMIYWEKLREGWRQRSDPSRRRRALTGISVMDGIGYRVISDHSSWTHGSSGWFLLSWEHNGCSLFICHLKHKPFYLSVCLLRVSKPLIRSVCCAHVREGFWRVGRGRPNGDVEVGRETEWACEAVVCLFIYRRILLLASVLKQRYPAYNL